jgi:predicted ArsR family transcriptional regulator
MSPGMIQTKSERTRQAILDLLSREGALTADAMAERLDLSILYVRPRVSELATQHRIAPSGERGRNVSGKLAHKWSAAS